MIARDDELPVELAEPIPARPEMGEIARAGIGERLAPYIGEIDPDPRGGARYADGYRDELEAIRLYRETLRDERCGSALEQRLNAATSRPWDVEPGGEADIDKAAAEDLAAQLQKIDFDAICRQLLHAVWYGYAIGECMWGVDGNRVTVADIAVRAPDRFRWSPEQQLLLRTERNAIGEPVGPAKFIQLKRPGEHGDIPHGVGLARWCYWPVWLKRNGVTFWSVALEKVGAPTPVGKHPPGATPQQTNKLLQIISALAVGSPIIHPTNVEIEYLATAARGTSRSGGDFEDFCKFLDRANTTTILGQSSTTDQGPWRGTAEVQKDIRDETVEADARLLDAELNRTLARWLTAWNFPNAATPIIRHDVEPPEDLDARATRDKTISDTTGLRPTRAYVERIYGGEWEPAPAPAPPGAVLAGPDERDPDGIDRALAEMLGGDGWERFMDPIVGPVLAAAQAAAARGDSLAQFRDSIPALFARMDDAELVETLRRMGFTARLSGDAGLIDRE